MGWQDAPLASAPKPYATAAAAAKANLRAGNYKVTPEELNYDETAAPPGAEERGLATAQAAAGHTPTGGTGLVPSVEPAWKSAPIAKPAAPKTVSSVKPAGDSGGETGTEDSPGEATAQGAGGVSDLLSTTLANLPHAISHAAQDIFHGGGMAPDQAPNQLGPAGQQLMKHITNFLAPILATLPSHQGAPQDIPGLGPTANDLARRGANVTQDLGTLAPLAAPLLKGAGAASEVAEAAPPLGMVTGADNPIARNLAGDSARPTVTAHNQAIADTHLGAQVGVPPGTPLGVKDAAGRLPLQKAADAPNAVYARVEASLPQGPLSPTAAQMVQNVGANDLVVRSPNVQQMIEAQKERLLTSDLTGKDVVDTQRALRYNGFKNKGLEDPENNALGDAQLNMADALHQHMVDSLPPDAAVSVEQLVQARQSLAQIHTLQDALRGNNIDLQKLAKGYRDNPNLFTGPMGDVAAFADQHPEVTRLPGDEERFNPSGKTKDVAAVDLKKPVSYVQPFLGAVARARLTNAPTAPVGGLGADFAPIVGPPKPLGGEFQ